MSKDKQTASVLYSYAKNSEDVTSKTAYLTSFDVEKLSKSTEVKSENQVIFSWSLDGAEDAIQKPGEFFLVCNEPNSQHYTGYLVKVDEDGKTENITAFNEIEGKNQYGYAKTQLEKIGLTNLPDSTTTTYLTTNTEYPADATGFCGDVVSYMARKFGENGTIPTSDNFKEDYPEIEKISEKFRQKNLEEGSKKITDEEKKSLEIADSDSGSTSKAINAVANKEMEEEVKKENSDLKEISENLKNPNEDNKPTLEQQEKANEELEKDGLGDAVKLAKKYDAVRKNKLNLSREFKDNIYNPLIKIINSESDVEKKLEEIKALKEKAGSTKEKNNGKGKEMMDLLFNVVESVLSDEELKEEDKKEFLKNFSKQFPEFKGQRNYQWSVPKTIGDVTSKLNVLVEGYQKKDDEVGKSIIRHIATASSQSELLKPLNDIVDKIKENGSVNAKDISKYGSQGFAVFLIIGTALGAPYMLPLALIGSIAVVKAGEMFGNKFRDPDREKTKEQIIKERNERKILKDLAENRTKENPEIEEKKENEVQPEIKVQEVAEKLVIDNEKPKLEDDVKKLESEKNKLIEKAEGGSKTEEDAKRIAAIEEEIKLKTGELDKLIKANTEDEKGKRKNPEEESDLKSDSKKPKWKEEEIKFDELNPEKSILEVEKRDLDDGVDKSESKKIKIEPKKTELAKSSEEDDSKKVEIEEKSRKDVLAKYGLDDSKRRVDPTSVKESKFSHGLPGGSREI